MSTTQKKVSVITVNFNSSDKLNTLIKSLSFIDTIVSEIIIIDNNSKDVDKIDLKNKKIRLFKNKDNVGFAKAVNKGINLSKNEIVLLLNPDCILTDSSPTKTLDKIVENKYIGMIGGKINYPDTTKPHYTATSKPNFFTGLFEFTNLKKIFPNNYFSNSFWVEKNTPINTLKQVFSLCGAYLFIRKNGKKHQNVLDEKYFLYLEDLDLGYIVENNGQLAVFDPESHVTHIGGSSSGSVYKIVLNHWYKSRKVFFLKNLPKYQGYILYIIFILEESFLTVFHKINNTPNA